MSIPPLPVSSLAAFSGLAPTVTGDQPLAPNMVYSIPLLPSSVFFSKDVIEKARTLNLYPLQEHMRYAVAQSLMHNERKHSSKGVFAKLKKLGGASKK